MLRGTTVDIHQRLCLTPAQQTKLRWAAGGFILTAALIYGGAIFGKESASSFSLSNEELLAFMQQSMKYLLPASGGGGILGGIVGYFIGDAKARQPSLGLEDDLFTQLNIQTADGRPGLVTNLVGDYGLTAEEGQDYKSDDEDYSNMEAVIHSGESYSPRP
jgi:hypothetical protein